MEPVISVIIPNRNGSRTIGKCLDALFASRYDRFEVIVVDDRSEDVSVGVIAEFPCRLLRLPRHRGAAHARNRGALQSRGKILFFIDADCVVQPDTLARVEQRVLAAGPDLVFGGTYTAVPPDKDLFSRFQSAFIRYFETKRAEAPDYVASHAMAIHATTFRKSGGFPEGSLPILEDVHFSHTLRRTGCRLIMDPAIEAQHIFNFSLVRSLRNAFRKSFYWTIYSLKNRDLLADSGTASRELKLNVASWFASSVAAVAGAVLNLPWLIFPALAVLMSADLYVNRRVIRAFRSAGGTVFAVQALVYYVLVYPVPVGAGVVVGVVTYAAGRMSRQRPHASLQKEA